MKEIKFTNDQKHDNYIKNFVKIFGKEGYSDSFKGCINRFEDVATGNYFMDSDMIWYTYIDKRDGLPYDSTLIPQRVLELNVTTKQLKGI